MRKETTKAKKNDEVKSKLALRNSQFLMGAKDSSTVLNGHPQTFSCRQLLTQISQLLAKMTHHSSGVAKMFAYK
jgi:hypothetical protein